MKKNKNVRHTEIPGGISYHDMRALLFWASVGISKSQGGSYPDAADHEGCIGLVRSCAEHIKFPLSFTPLFRGEAKPSWYGIRVRKTRHA